MACCASICTTKVFLFINIAFAMYAGALLSTAARLAWDPSTYAWFRFLCGAQYRVTAGYLLAAGLWLAALVTLAACAAQSASAAATPALAAPSRPHRAVASSLKLYTCGLVALLASEAAYGAWLAASLAAWWRDAPQAEFARRTLDLVHDLKPALLAFDRYKDIARPIYHMIEEVEREAPNNVYVVVVFAMLAMLLQIMGVCVAWRLAARARVLCEGDDSSVAGDGCEKDGKSGPRDDDSDCAGEERAPPAWRKTANLRMYTILDKIF